MSKVDMNSEEWSEFLGKVTMRDIDAFWYATFDLRPDAGFEARKQLFFDGLEMAVRGGWVKLQSAGVVLTTPASEEFRKLYDAWPEESQFDEDLFWITKSDKGWTTFGLVWVADDGAEIWM